MSTYAESDDRTTMEDPMLHELLAGAAKTMAGQRYCWLITTAEDGIHGRPMGRIPSEVGPQMDKTHLAASVRNA